MKKFVRWGLALGLCLALLVVGALAADAADIAVQLDGQALTFTDAAPQVRDQRTFLPFRAVFEAMGAQVSNEGSVITAVRGDKTLTMTLDQTVATVTENGVSTPITMDVAPYVDPATWRTYVPVRFAAQAFDCAVGWDQNAYTAIIIDTDKLLDAALAGKSYTYLDKLTALDGKYDQGIWDVTAAFDADASFLTVPAMTISGDMTGTVQDADKLSMDMTMKLDMTRLMEIASSASGEALDAEDQAALDALAQNGVGLAMRGDLTAGKLYMNMDFSGLSALSGGEELPDPNTWYEMDLAEVLEEADMDWAQLMAQSKTTDPRGVVKALLSLVEPDDAAGDYAQIKTVLEGLLTAFSDQGFAPTEDGRYAASYTLTADGATATVTLALTLEGETPKGYTMDVDVTAPVDDDGQSLGMRMTVSMDDQDQMTAAFTMDAGMMAMDMTMNGTYTPGTTVPEAAPPAGAAVVPFTEMMDAEDDGDDLDDVDDWDDFDDGDDWDDLDDGDDLDLGVIGGADGPTAIWVD